MSCRAESEAEPKAIHFPHDADIGVCGVGPTIEAAFEQGALAMTAVMTDPAKIELKGAVQIDCDAPNAELLFVDWLNAIVFDMATRDMIFGAFRSASMAIGSAASQLARRFPLRGTALPSKSRAPR